MLMFHHEHNCKQTIIHLLHLIEGHIEIIFSCRTVWENRIMHLTL